jgi:hypothetical protein
MGQETSHTSYRQRENVEPAREHFRCVSQSLPTSGGRLWKLENGRWKPKTLHSLTFMRRPRGLDLKRDWVLRLGE